jgi:hypothetical protein
MRRLPVPLKSSLKSGRGTYSTVKVRAVEALLQLDRDLLLVLLVARRVRV